MNEHVLQAILEKWKQEAKLPDCMDGAPEADRGNAIMEGTSRGILNCIEDIENLIALLEPNRTLPRRK